MMISKTKTPTERTSLADYCNRFDFDEPLWYLGIKIDHRGPRESTRRMDYGNDLLIESPACAKINGATESLHLPAAPHHSRLFTEGQVMAISQSTDSPAPIPAKKIHRTCSGESVHGRRSTEYNSWRAMINRCLRPNTDQFEDYGGRGITVCGRWTGEFGFSNFLADMGRKPSRKHSIERNDTNGGYCPENCRWATPSEQNRNRRSSVILEFNGERRSLIEWSELLGMSNRTLAARLRVLKWSVEKALTTPCAGLGANQGTYPKGVVR